MPRNVIISAAITGSIHTPTMSPYLPITPEQIAGEAIDAARAGAAAVHIHARNPENGMPSPDLNLFYPDFQDRGCHHPVRTRIISDTWENGIKDWDKLGII